MNVFGVGLPEMAVIAVIALIVFGPRKLPELGRTLGRTLRSFQSASQAFEQEFRKAIDTPPQLSLYHTRRCRPIDKDRPQMWRVN